MSRVFRNYESSNTRAVREAREEQARRQRREEAETRKKAEAAAANAAMVQVTWKNWIAELWRHIDRRITEAIQAWWEQQDAIMTDAIGEVIARERQQFRKQLADGIGELRTHLTRELQDVAQVATVLERQLSDIQRDLAHANDTARQLHEMEHRLDAKREADEARRGPADDLEQRMTKELRDVTDVVVTLERKLLGVERDLANANNIDARMREAELRLEARQATLDEARRGPPRHAGKVGPRGEKGDRGVDGKAGKPGRDGNDAVITSWHVNRKTFKVTPSIKVGERVIDGPALELHGLFEEYQQQTATRTSNGRPRSQGLCRRCPPIDAAQGRQRLALVNRPEAFDELLIRAQTSTFSAQSEHCRFLTLSSLRRRSGCVASR